MFRTIDRECEWWLGFNISVAVAVGFIALASVAAETGVIMLIYLDHAMKELQAERAAEGKEFTRADQCGKRVRPIMGFGLPSEPTAAVSVERASQDQTSSNALGRPEAAE